MREEIPGGVQVASRCSLVWTRSAGLQEPLHEVLTDDQRIRRWRSTPPSLPAGNEAQWCLAVP